MHINQKRFQSERPREKKAVDQRDEAIVGDGMVPSAATMSGSINLLLLSDASWISPKLFMPEIPEWIQIRGLDGPVQLLGAILSLKKHES